METLLTESIFWFLFFWASSGKLLQATAGKFRQNGAQLESLEYHVADPTRFLGARSPGINQTTSLEILRQERLVSAAQLSHNRSHELFCVAKEHQGVIKIVKRIVNTGEAGTHAAFDDHHGVGFVDIEDGHAVDGAGRVGAGGGVGDVVGADDEGYVGLR